jgi:predicted  nucleic acid-binding Zn-ribbon protein
MRADPAAQRLLLELADADAEVARAGHRRTTAPEIAAVDELVEALRVHRDAAVSAQIAAEDQEREVRRLENEIAVLTTREQKDTALRDSGKLQGKGLVEIDHELRGLARRRGLLEEELLEVMERQEATAGEELRCGALVTQTEEQLAEAREKADAVVGDIDVQVASAARHREEIRGRVEPALLAVYDQQVSRGRVGAGLLRQARCGACRMEIDRGTLARYGKADADEVLRCEECGAVIVRTHESGV